MNVRRVSQLLRYFGPGWLMYRAVYALRMKSGLMQRQSPATSWDNLPIAKFLNDAALSDPDRLFDFRHQFADQFLFDPGQRLKSQPLLRQWDIDGSPLEIAVGKLRKGFVQFFSHEFVDVGSPPQWQTDPLTGHRFPNDRHWSLISDFGAGDIKLVWESNRFGFVYPLVRSYWRTGDDNNAELFWQLVEDWRNSNPPETGVNWKCGQEISLRVMAWCFGLYAFNDSPATTPARVSMLAQMVAVSGQRIESNIGYALSQQNNHGLSEAMGLWTIGSLFPEFRQAARWSSQGRRLLESQGRALIYDDGGFSQHSLNYHRVMLQIYLWSLRLGDVLQRPFSDSLRERIGKAGEFVYQLHDPATGCVPRIGQDDGALILPLSNCAYDDYRPVIQASHYLVSGQQKLDAGPWNEDLFWLFGVDRPARSKEESPVRPVSLKLANGRESIPPADFEAPTSGYVTLRSATGCAVTRAARFRHRPSQADMLHVDIWWKGVNIALDPGTYSYNAPPPWDNPFSHTRYHNTVSVDGLDQMDRAGRFLWLPWLKGTSFGRKIRCDGDASAWNGEHDGYGRLSDPVVHRRGIVRIGQEHWLIVDALRGTAQHDYCLQWLLADTPFQTDLENFQLRLQTGQGEYRLAAAASAGNSVFDVCRADPSSPRGWFSPFYHVRRPALSVSIASRSTEIVFATLLGPDAQAIQIENDSLLAQGSDWTSRVFLNRNRDLERPLIASVVVGSVHPETLPRARFSCRNLQELRQCTSC